MAGGPSAVCPSVNHGRPMIGATSQVIHSAKWYKTAVDLGFEALEINRRNTRLHLNTFHLAKVKRYLQDLNTSLHSSTTGIFQELESFSQAELATLKAEVDMARILESGEFVFHINAGRMDVTRRHQLRQIIDYAHDSGVLPIYESDAGMNARQVLSVLDIFPDVGYALDLGHLNNARGRNLLGCRIATFIEEVNDRIVYIHANNNDGIRDQHYGLEQGSLQWEAVLDRIDMRQVIKIIIEVCSADHLEGSRRALNSYLDRRQPFRPINRAFRS